MEILKYKLRAECKLDFDNFIKETGKLISNIRYNLIGKNIPDVVIEFESVLSKEQIIHLMQNLVEDSHVMWQTIQPINLYTGERNPIPHN